MKTLPLAEWLWPLATAAAALLTWFGPRMERKLATTPRPLRPKKPTYAELPTEEWCPAHDSWYGAETECPGCREEWEQTWTLGEEPEEQKRRDDWTDQQEEQALAAQIDEYEARQDGWYLDLLARMKMGQDPHNEWRD